MLTPSQVLEVLHDGHSFAVDGGGVMDEGGVRVISVAAPPFLNHW